MKTIKRVTALMLALCMLIGLPLSVGAEDTAVPLTITSVTPNAWTASEYNKIKFTFSEQVSDTAANLGTVLAAVGIYNGTTEGQYHYKWDEASGTCTQVSATNFDGQTGTTQWDLSNFGRRSQGQNQLMGTLPSGWTLPMIMAVYKAIKAEYPQARLVAKLSDKTGEKDGYVDGICALNDSSKKLTVSNISSTQDWAETHILQELTGANLQEGALLMHFLNPVKRAMNASYKLGLYKDGVLNAEAGTWTVTAANLRAYGEDNLTLVTDFADYDAVMAALAAKPDHVLGLTVISKKAGIDVRVEDDADAAGRQLMANTAVDGVDAVYAAVSTEKETLRLIDAKYFNSNQLLITFNKPVTVTNKHYIGLSLYAPGTNNMMAYKLNDEGTSYIFDKVGTIGAANVNGNGTTTWARAQWNVGTMTPFNAAGTQYRVTLSANVAVAAIQAILEGTNYDLRLRIQENAGMGAGNGVVDTICASADATDRLLASVYDANQDQAWVSVSGWAYNGTATIGTVEYDTLEKALDVAVSGDTVKLNGYVRADMVKLPAGVTLDLSGNVLITDNFFGFGYVIDSAQGGALIADRDRSSTCIHLQVDNPMFPLYDASVKGYRFFTYSLSSAGTKANAENADCVKYGIKLKFDSLRAYELLADPENADVALVMELAIANRTFAYKFNHNIFNTLYQTVKSNDFANRGNYAITLTISGLDTVLPEDKLVATPILYSAQKVRSNGKTIAYEGTYDSYTRAKAWIREQIDNNTLFSFTYDGAAYADHMTEENWAKEEVTTESGWIVSYTHKKDNVVAWSEITFDPETASVEWTNYFKNNGTSNSPVIGNIRAMNSTVTVENPTLTSANGSTAQATDFQPFSVDLTQTPSYVNKMKTSGGRSSQGAFPYFDISNGTYGIMGAIGWTGNWSANFVNDNGAVTIDAGMQSTNISLYAGEQMRTPMIMIQFFKGDQDAGHNALRRLMLKSYTPSDASGKPIEHAMLSVGVVNTAGQGEEAVLEVAKKLESSGSAYECLWIDAGWFGDKSGDANLSDGTWSKQVGNWYFIEDVYPEGIQNLRQYLEEQNKGLVLWFEPERVAYGTQLAKDEYILRKRSAALDDLAALTGNTPMFLYNFADDDACNYMIDTISGMIQESNVTWYRQDFNIEPESYWSYNENSNRKGMTEIKYITNLYRYLDELVERNPGLMIDNCAAGGRRLDLEMMKRSVPLWNSDYATKKPDEDGNGGSTPDGIRANNYNLSWWLPIHSGGWPNYNSEDTTYAFHVDMNSGMQLDASRAMNATVKNLTQQYFTCRELMNGDYYILADGKDAGIETEDACYEFYKAEKGKGYLVAFRPENCTTESATYYLKGLDAKATYKLEIVDGETFTMTGEQLMTDGLTINYSKANLSLLIYFNKA